MKGTMSSAVRLPSKRSGRFWPLIFVTAHALLTVQLARAYVDVQPEVMQKHAIQIVGQYREHFRRTGDLHSLLPELRKAYGELEASYSIFLDRKDFAAAALSVLTMADIERMATVPDLIQGAALGHYARARELARQANHLGYQCRAAIGLARIEMKGKNLTGADDDIREAIRLATASD